MGHFIRSLLLKTSIILFLIAASKYSTAQPFSIVFNGPGDICGPNNTYLSISPSGGTSFKWYNWVAYPYGIWIATGPEFYHPQTGNWMCEVTTSSGVYTTFPVTVRTDQPFVTTPNGSTDCSGSSVYLREENSFVAGYGIYNSYQWRKDGNDISGATDWSYNAAMSGSYSCVVGLWCGSGTSNSTAVTVQSAPGANITAGGATTFCSGSSVTLSANSGSYNYQWKNGATAISGATNQNYTATASGSYTCDVSNTCGTTGSNTINVTVIPAPTSAEAMITAGGPTTFCKGSSVVLSVATAGLTYQWMKGNNNLGGATQQSYTATKTGTYKCVVSNACGSITSNSISVTQNSLPTVSISQSPCSGGTILLTCTSNPNTGVTYQWKKGSTTLSGATNPTYNAAQNGTYKCTVTVSATGCTKTSAGSSVTITCKLGDEVTNTKVIVYPNPTADYFNITSAQLDAKSVIYIYDLTGRLVESHKVIGGEMKIGQTLSNGVYFLKIESNNEVQQVIKLVKNF